MTKNPARQPGGEQTEEREGGGGPAQSGLKHCPSDQPEKKGGGKGRCGQKRDGLAERETGEITRNRIDQKRIEVKDTNPLETKGKLCPS